MQSMLTDSGFSADWGLKRATGTAKESVGRYTSAGRRTVSRLARHPADSLQVISHVKVADNQMLKSYT